MMMMYGAVTFGTGALLTQNVEHHIAIVRDGGTWRLYLDGIQATSTVNAGAASTSANTCYIGNDPFDLTTREFPGRIRRMKISNVARYPSGTTFTPPSPTSV